MSRARLAAYARWQARDIVFQRLVAYVMVAFFLVVPLIVARFEFNAALSDPETWARMQASTLANTIALLGFTGPLIAINGILSTDRERGYYRMLFAKPVSPLAFYVQDFLLSGALLLLATALMALAMRFTIAPMVNVGAVVHLALGFALWGSIGFFFSTFLRFDWMGTLLAGGLAQVAGTLAEHHVRGAAFATAILPPLKAELDTVGPLLSGNAPAGGDVLRIVGYGAVCFLLAILVLKRRPIGA